MQQQNIILFWVVYNHLWLILAKSWNQNPDFNLNPKSVNLFEQKPVKQFQREIVSGKVPKGWFDD